VQQGITQQAQKELLERIEARFEPYRLKTSLEINNQLGAKYDPEGKSFCSNLVRRILRSPENQLLLLQGAGIVDRTVRLTVSGMPSQNVSLPAFDYIELSKEQWEVSTLRGQLQQSFLFFVFRIGRNDAEVFTGIQLWSMPQEDREGEAKRVWEHAVDAVKCSRFEQLPKESESPVLHVRPHGQDGEDKILARDGSMQPRKSFWIKAAYIGAQLNRK
jgi:DNA mismatch repair protein MutH